MMKNENIYEFENHLSDSRIVEKPVTRVMYDIRKMSEHIRKTGRPLTELEAQHFMICQDRLIRIEILRHTG